MFWEPLGIFSVIVKTLRRSVCSSTGYPLYLPAHLWEHSYLEPSCCIPRSLHVGCWCIVMVTRCSAQIQTAAIHSIPAHHRSESSTFFCSYGLTCVSGPLDLIVRFLSIWQESPLLLIASESKTLVLVFESGECRHHAGWLPVCGVTRLWWLVVLL